MGQYSMKAGVQAIRSGYIELYLGFGTEKRK